MDGSFACPECGSELVLKGLSPGRQVRCGWCETWVEVPYLPRAGPRSRRSRTSARRWVPLAWAGLGVLFVLVLGLGTIRVIRHRGSERTERALAELSDSAKSYESAGRLDQAREEIEKAVELTATLGPAHAERLEALRRQRDKLSKRAAEARLAATATASHSQAIAECLALRAQAREDAALADLEDAIGVQLEKSRRAAAESDATAADAANLAGRTNEAIDLSTRVVQTVDELQDKAVRRRLQSGAEALVKAIVAKQGVVLEPVRGQFTLGSPRSYNETLHPILDGVLRQRGYLMRRPASPWNRLWDEHAPYHVAVEVAERHEGNYHQSQNRLSVIEARLSMSEKGSPIWRAGPLIGRSPLSLPKLPAFYESRVSVGDHRSEDFERLLYDKARELLIEKFPSLLRNLPSLNGFH